MRGEVILVVDPDNWPTALGAIGFFGLCAGFQYRGLEALHQAFGPRGFSVLGFPCNQFGGQEPGDAAQIEKFCASNYAITFPMFAKIDVNGSGAHPLFNYLKSEKAGLLAHRSNGISPNSWSIVRARWSRVMRRPQSRNH